MIFSASRFVVVDDKIEHLQAITDAFQKIGTPCFGIHFDEANALDPNHFRGVRCLFLDLHLASGQMSTDNKGDYARIQTILEDNISANGGPFVLIMWTQHPHLRAELAAYLDDNLDEQRPFVRPLAILCLEKDNFIRSDRVNIEALREAVRTVVSSNAQLAAILGWETDVLAAAADTLTELIKLVPDKDRTSTSYPGALDIILSRLAKAAVGRQHVETNERTAITSALAPILADRIINQAVPSKMAALWKLAVTKANDDKLPPASNDEAGAINRMLHLAKSGSEIIKPSDWGAVISMPTDIWNDPVICKRMFDGTVAELMTGDFKIKEADQAKCKPILVRIGAACDHAQKNRGPLSYLLGFEIPTIVKRDGKPTGAEWKSPIFVGEGNDLAFCLHVNVRFVISITPTECENWQIRYRLREQLLMSLVSFTSNYTSRPGIVDLR